jgi:hypothetical protein
MDDGGTPFQMDVLFQPTWGDAQIGAMKQQKTTWREKANNG